jgi:hypothetical protein
MRAIAGAILIHAGCALVAADGLADDVALVPILAGVAYLIADLFLDGAKKTGGA